MPARFKTRAIAGACTRRAPVSRAMVIVSSVSPVRACKRNSRTPHPTRMMAALGDSAYL